MALNTAATSSKYAVSAGSVAVGDPATGAAQEHGIRVFVMVLFFIFGGITSLNGISNLATRQTSSRIGVTAALPITRSQSIKISYNDGAYIRYGGNYNNVSVAWQFSWIGRPK